MTPIHCPSCRKVVVQVTPEGVALRVDGRVLFTDGGCKCRCFWCSANLDLPLVLSLRPEQGVVALTFAATSG